MSRRPKERKVDAAGQSYELVPIEKLKPHPRNVNRGDSVAISESIEENGFFGAVIAQRSTGFILVGNHRWQSLKETGATEVPTIFVDCDDKRALKILLADNRIARLGEDNSKELADLLTELSSSTGLRVVGQFESRPTISAIDQT